MIQAVLRNAAHPEYGEATIPFPIPEEEYGHCLELLEALEIGNAVNRDCKVQEVQDGPPILKRLEGSRVNLDELDYLAKRLDSFTDQELAQFQSAAVSYDYSNIVDLINLTFSCQEVTVITDFSDLESIGRNHYMTLNGGSARMEELDNLDGTETALLLIESGDGVITPYGVVYDNCMRLSQDYDGRHLPEYYYTRCTVSVMLSADGRPEQQEMLYFPCAESKISRAVRRLGVDRPEQCTATLKLAEVSDAVSPAQGTDRRYQQERAHRAEQVQREVHPDKSHVLRPLRDRLPPVRVEQGRSETGRVAVREPPGLRIKIL